jgi:hypothetical protein
VHWQVGQVGFLYKLYFSSLTLQKGDIPNQYRFQDVQRGRYKASGVTKLIYFRPDREDLCISQHLHGERLRGFHVRPHVRRVIVQWFCGWKSLISFIAVHSACGFPTNSLQSVTSRSQTLSLLFTSCGIGDSRGRTSKFRAELPLQFVPY